jgi:hypothetical protein|tara:strand:- start:397 stop:690 length:294 start_codon:yes stop_codon:yes gene_type:complete
MANEETKVIEEQTSNETPLSEGEREQVQEIVQNNQEIQQALGNLAVRKIQLEAQENQLKQQFATNSQKETEFAQKIESKYGRGSLNLERGVFIPLEQ